ncbi:hypothetical protein MNBD_GAMMA07-1690 [hydrothermal vent metagenome]|uniref:RND transporter n=1 Tax=hydrothermal vent metagenome TaxID=652676 RepID=A0A3B0WMM8_9ZZZZ
MKQLLNKIPLFILAFPALFLAVAPLTGDPHLLEKLNMLFNGSLSKPIDIFDLFMHATPLSLLILKIFFIVSDKFSKNNSTAT